MIPTINNDIGAAGYAVTHACALLRTAGCRILAAHIHGNCRRVIIDRRPRAIILDPGRKITDPAGTVYAARMGSTQVEWRVAA